MNKESTNPKSQRRSFLKNLGHLSFGALNLSLLTGFQSKLTAAAQSGKRSVLFDQNQDYSEQVISLVRETTCFDMLSFFEDHFNKRDGMTLNELWKTVPNSFSKEDYEFVRSCGVDVFGWGDMVPTYEGTLEYMAVTNGLIASNPDYLERIDTKAKIQNLQQSKKIGILIANQDSQHFRTLDDVNLFYGLGQRVSQLTYNGSNKLGNGAFDDKDNGLTAYGKQVVERMNEVGMAVDVSHCGDQTTLGGIEASSKPVLITPCGLSRHCQRGSQGQNRRSHQSHGGHKWGHWDTHSKVYDQGKRAGDY